MDVSPERTPEAETTVPTGAGDIASVVNAPPPVFRRTPRLRRRVVPIWGISRERWMDAGSRWAFAGQDRTVGEPVPSRRREPAAPRAGVVPESVLPYAVQVVVAWCVAVVAFAWAARVFMNVVGAVAVVVIPLAVAVLLAAFLHPLVRVLDRRLGMHRALAALVAVLGLFGALLAGSVLAGTQLASGMQDMMGSVQQGVDAITVWLQTGPLHISGAQLDDLSRQVQEEVRKQSGTLSTSAISAGISTIDFVAGTIVCLISTFFFLYDGGKIWAFLTGWLPRGARRPVYEAGRRGWVSLSAYARTQIIVAGCDAVSIAGGAFALGLPLVVPLFFIVFVASVVPIAGAVVAGVVPVLMALVVKGPVTALTMLLIVLFVQQVEAHILQPFLMGRAVDLHPLAVIIAVTAAAYLFGIPGALFAVPVLAFVNMAARYLLGDDPFPEIGDRRSEAESEEAVGGATAV